MHQGFIEALEGRSLLSASVAAEVLGIESPWVLGDHSTPTFSNGAVIQPMKKSAPVIPPYGGHYEGVLTSLYFKGVQETNINGTYSDFSVTRLDIVPGKRRNYGNIRIGNYVEIGMGIDGFASIDLSGKKGTNFFKLYGSDGNFSGAPGTVDISIKLTSSADGRRFIGSLKSTSYGMVPQANITYAGEFSVKRING